MKNTKKLKLPEKNVEYTFAISGKISKRILLYSITTSTGNERFVFRDVNDDFVYKSISAWQFNEYKRKHQIINERKLDKYVAPVSVPKTPSDNQEVFWQSVKERIRNIPETLNANVVSLIGYTPKYLAKEMDNLDTGGYTKEYELRVMANVRRVYNLLDKYNLEPEPETKNTMQESESDRISPSTLIKLLKSISPSMSKKCNARFGYPLYELIDKLNNLSDKDTSYIDSIYKETDRVLYYVGYKKPVIASI